MAEALRSLLNRIAAPETSRPYVRRCVPSPRWPAGSRGWRHPCGSQNQLSRRDPALRLGDTALHLAAAAYRRELVRVISSPPTSSAQSAGRRAAALRRRWRAGLATWKADRAGRDHHGAARGRRRSECDRRQRHDPAASRHPQPLRGRGARAAGWRCRREAHQRERLDGDAARHPDHRPRRDRRPRPRPSKRRSSACCA